MQAILVDNIQYTIILTLLLISHKGVIMMKEILLLLIATFHTSPIGSKYLLVQLEDASDGGTEEPLIEPPIAIQHQGKQGFRN